MDNIIFLSPGEVAEMLNTTPQDIRRQCRDGLIKAERSLNGRGSWRIDTDAFFEAHPDKREEFKNKMLDDRKRTIETIKMLNEMAKSGDYDCLLDEADKT